MYQMLGMMALGSLMGGSKGGSSTTVQTTTEQIQNTQFNPSIVIQSPAASRADAPFSPNASQSADQSARTGNTPASGSISAEQADTASLYNGGGESNFFKDNQMLLILVGVLAVGGVLWFSIK